MTDRPDFRTTRLYVDGDLLAGAEIDADTAQRHYLTTVLRMRSGERILLFNGRDGEWQAEIRLEGRRSCHLRVERMMRPQPATPDLHYVFAPLKKARLDYMIQKAVELGASRLRPVVSDHTQARNPKQDRMIANAIEAAEQCGVLWIPEIAETAPLTSVLETWEESRVLVVADEAADPVNPLPPLTGLKGRPLAVLVGPEGGFSPAERSAFERLDFVVKISLGHRILRADTAGVAVLALVQAAAGDWAS